MNREQAMKQVQMYSFALYDTGLFLDTHPTNQAALVFYEETQKKYVEAVAFYEEEFGPLEAYNAASFGSFKWLDSPWPWEREANA